MTEVSDSWIERMIAKSHPLDHTTPFEEQLAKLLVETCYKNIKISSGNIGLLLASAFDLFVAGQYYSALLHKGWLYCPSKIPRLYFPFTNCCPRHVLKNDFYFHRSNKPQSGRIGTATSRILLLFYRTLFQYHGRDEEILKGYEPVDVVIINRNKKKVLFAEIKASPLTILSVSAPSQQIMEDMDGEVVSSGHSHVTNANLFNSKLEILIPQKRKNVWEEKYFDIGTRNDASDKEWGFRGLINLLQKDALFFKDYFSFWKETFDVYHPKSPESIFWLTNACGTPRPIPSGWAKRKSGSGYESVSDSKTSVGMDRTDDIKKGIYQVLKLGSDGKIETGLWDFKVGILSNIHAARHFGEYLESLKDIVWTLDSKRKAKKVSDLPKDQALYNLFDGIVTFTQTIARDKWIETLFNF